MRFERLDLNLLVAFDALVREQSISGAAARLNLTQSALSSSLSRLREFFGDELLVKSGRRMILTPKARQLTGPVGDALLLIRSRITTPHDFHPSDTERHFVIQASDYTFNLLLADAVRRASAIAPHVSFEITSISAHASEQLRRGEIDLLIGVGSGAINEVIAADHPQLHLFVDECVMICCRESEYGDCVSTAEFSRAGHVAVRLGAEPDRVSALTEQLLAAHGPQRRIEVVVPDFASAPPAVIGTQRIAVLYRRHAEFFAGMMPVVVKPLPFALPAINTYVQWNGQFTNDQGVDWLIGMVKRRCGELDALAYAAPP